MYYRYLYKRSAIFASILVSPGRSHVDSLFSNEEHRRGWSVTYLILLPHMPALFMTSLIHCEAPSGNTHGRVFGAFIHVTSNVCETSRGIESKNAAASILNSLPVDRARGAFSVRLSYKEGE